jgi:hypothetical protein
MSYFFPKILMLFYSKWFLSNISPTIPCYGTHSHSMPLSYVVLLCYLMVLSVSRLHSAERMISEYGAVGGMRIGRRIRNTQRKSAPVPLFLPQIPACCQKFSFLGTKGVRWSSKMTERETGNARISVSYSSPSLSVQPLAFFPVLFFRNLFYF